MYVVGLDIHLRSVSYCILDERGHRVKEGRIVGGRSEVLAELSKLTGPWTACFEASGSYGPWHDALKERAAKVVMAHPGKVRLIFAAKRKNDRIDARKIATLLYLDQIPEAWAPRFEVRKWRELIEGRRRLVGKRTRTKNGLAALFRRCGVERTAPPLPARPAGGRASAPRKGLGKAGREALRAWPMPTSSDALQRDLLLEELEQFERQIRRVEQELDRMAEGHPGVALLRTIPGVGPRTAEAVLAYVDDPHRFGRSKELSSYAGLVPSQDASGSVNRLGHITKQGPPTMRWLLVEAAWQGIRRSARLRTFYDRIHQGRKDRRKLALVATAHYLLRIMLAMLKSGEAWRETNGTAEASAA